MNEQLTLNNGTILGNSSAVISGDLYLYIRGGSLADVFNLLIDPDNTAEIVYTMINGEDVTFSGFVRLTSVRDEENGMITAVLKKAVNNNV